MGFDKAGGDFPGALVPIRSSDFTLKAMGKEFHDLICICKVPLAAKWRLDCSGVRKKVRRRVRRLLQ